MNYKDTNDFLRWNKPNVFILNKQKAKKLSPPQLISSKYIVKFITTTLLLINCLICNFDVKADIVYGRNENGEVICVNSYCAMATPTPMVMIPDLT